jgi:hypothetical protein
MGNRQLIWPDWSWARCQTGARVKFVPGQPTPHERVLQRFDHLLAASVARPEPSHPPPTILTGGYIGYWVAVVV